jgi:hypothetical protein
MAATCPPSDEVAEAAVLEAFSDLELYPQAREIFLTSAEKMLDTMSDWVEPRATSDELTSLSDEIRDAGGEVIRERYTVMEGLMARRHMDERQAADGDGA